jgi:hypothetical protein
VCRKDFTVTTGTFMERSHMALNKLLIGFYLMASSKKGISPPAPPLTRPRLRGCMVHGAPAARGHA